MIYAASDKVLQRGTPCHCLLLIISHPNNPAPLPSGFILQNSLGVLSMKTERNHLENNVIPMKYLKFNRSAQLYALIDPGEQKKAGDKI